MRAEVPPTIEQLLAHKTWVQELAHRLVRDPYLAEDLAQATCVTAIERPPAGVLRRGWLATVLRNLLRQHRRREGERAVREARAARPEALPSAASMVERVQVQRQVVEAVLGLGEPYRSVVLWRFFEDMSPGEIARRRGVPVATVHSQLNRALGKLCGRLAAEHRDRRSLLVALLPLSRPARSASVSTLGALIMKTKLISAASVLIGTAVLAWVLWPRTDDFVPPMSEPVRTPAAQGAMQTAGEEPPAERSALPQVTAGEVGVELVAAVAFQGRVFDVLGRPVPGVTVVVRPDVGAGSSEPTDVEGVFMLSLPPMVGQLHVVEAGWVTLVAGQVPDRSSDTPIEPVLVTAPRIELAGLVTDRSGEPVVGVDVLCRVPSDFAVRIPFSLDATQPLYRRWQSNTGADGRFRLPDIGVVPGATLIARKAGYLPAEVEQPQEAGQEVHLVLDRPDLDEEVVLGQVLDPFANPVEGAEVALGRGSAQSDAAGMFRLTREKSAGAQRLTAMLRGHLPGVAEVPASEEGAPPPFVYVYLGDEPLHIRGRVVEPDGTPVAGARLWPVETQLVPGINGSVEGYLSGGPTDQELVERFTSNGRLIASLGDIKERNPSAAWAWVVTDVDGSFDLGGLQDRDYTLRLLVDAGLQIADSGPHRAGSVVEILFQPEVYPVVSGRVLGFDGQPIGGVTIEVNRWATYGEMSLPDGSTYSTGDAISGPVLRTDDDGRFRIENFGRGGLWFTISGDDIMNQNFGLHEQGYENATERSFDDLEFQVERRLHIRLELGRPELANRFRVLDEAGEPIPIVNFEGGGRASSGSWSIQEGRTRVYAVSEKARSVALLQGDEEVDRFPVTLRPGIVNVISR